jgi:FKBP-type peptidyl-prolyl cis-trans isomerase FklB
MKRSIIVLSLVSVLVSGLRGQDKAAGFTLSNANDSLSYSFGLLIGSNMAVQGVETVNYDVFLKAFQDGFADRQDIMEYTQANEYIESFFTSLASKEADMNLAKSQAFLEENAKQEGVVVLPSGLQYKELTAGSGESPKASEQVRVHYHGTFIDGKVFDSSIDRGEPIVFGVNQVIAGWTEALQLMKPGSRWMLYIPPYLAYGQQGAGGVIGPNMALIFEVELIEVVR